MEWVVAHQGGWDEFLMFAVPILIALGAVKYAERRGERKRDDSEQSAVEPGGGELG